LSYDFGMLNGKPFRETVIDLLRVFIFIIVVYYLIDILVKN